MTRTGQRSGLFGDRDKGVAKGERQGDRAYPGSEQPGQGEAGPGTSQLCKIGETEAQPRSKQGTVTAPGLPLPHTKHRAGIRV